MGVCRAAVWSDDVEPGGPRSRLLREDKNTGSGLDGHHLPFLAHPLLCVTLYELPEAVATALL